MQYSPLVHLLPEDTHTWIDNMCLILFSYQQNDNYKLILAANRDEFYERPTSQAGPWDEVQGLIAGKDLKAGGTWMGVHAEGRYGMVTNYRDPSTEIPRPSSRGQVVLDYLAHQEQPDQYLQRLKLNASAYNGYNTLLGNHDGLWYYSNKSTEIRRIEPGLYGLSNHLLDTSWPKVVRGKALLKSIIEEETLDVEALFHMLQDDRIAPDHELPQTGVPLEWERTLSSMFIRSDGYGTRCSSILLISSTGDTKFYERTYPANGSRPTTLYYSL